MSDAYVASKFLETMGISEILAMDGVTEVAINQSGKLWFEAQNGWEYKESEKVHFSNCQKLANLLCVQSGLSNTIGVNYPIASVVLPDGERGQIIHPPACEKDTVAFCFRKPSIERFTLKSYSDTGRLSGAKKAKRRDLTLTESQQSLLALYELDNSYDFLAEAIKNKLNILLVGATGSGKTTIMKALVDLFPLNARISTIEDVHELSLPYHLNHIHLFYKEGGVTSTDIIKANMRLKIDHILLAELRGNESFSYLEALNTGHAGSVSTIHANDCFSAFFRLADLIKQSPIGRSLDYQFILDKVMTTIDVICFCERTKVKEIYYDPALKNKIEAKGIIQY